MVRIKILGSGCAECQVVETLVHQVVDDMAVEAEIISISDYDEIRKYPIMSTPALIVNDLIMCDGRVPSQQEIASWLHS
jgi:small redox-active disulfide protein 2